MDTQTYYPYASTTSIPPGKSPVPVTSSDVARLFLEFTEVAKATGCGRDDLIDLFRRVVHAGVGHLFSGRESATFRQAVHASLAARQHRRPCTLADLRSYTCRFLKLEGLADCELRSITRQQCRHILKKSFSHSAHVYRKAKAILHSIFAYGFREGWCESNPVEGIESPPLQEERIEALTTRQIRAMVKACGAKDLLLMEPAFRLMLWCGIRPGEVRRLRWGDIDCREGVVYIESWASKTGGARAVPLRGGALALCHIRRPDDELIAPRNWIRLWAKLRRRAGMRRWQRDALRHTFASFHLKHFHNLSQLQEEMGHRDCTLLRTRYLNLRHVSTGAARRFFQNPSRAK